MADQALPDDSMSSDGASEDVPKAAGDTAPTTAPPLTSLSVVFCFLLLVAVLLFSRLLRLRLERPLLIATLRAVLQLSVLAYCLLMPLFRLRSLPLLLAYFGFMLLVSTVEAAGRTAHTYPRHTRHALIAIALPVSIVLAYAMFFIVPPHEGSHLSPQTAVPILGMLLGNCITAYSLTLDRFIANLTGHKAPEIEIMTAFGATTWEAALSPARAALSAGLTPSLNTLSVLGLVSIPGMMTGQILGGQPPVEAAKYQIMILLMQTACGAFSGGIGLLLATSTLFAANHTLQHGLVVKRDRKSADVLVRLVYGVLLPAVNALAGCVRPGTHASTQGYEEMCDVEEGRAKADEALRGARWAALAVVRYESALSECILSAKKGTAFFSLCDLPLISNPSDPLSNTFYSSFSNDETPELPEQCANDNTLLDTSRSTSLDPSRMPQRPPLQEHPGETKHAFYGSFSVGLGNGDILIVTGRSGVGKSTLLKTIVQMDSPAGDCTSGAASQPPWFYIDSQARGSIPICEWRRRVLLVPQDCPQLPDCPLVLLHTVLHLACRKEDEARLRTCVQSSSAANDSPLHRLGAHAHRALCFLSSLLCTPPEWQPTTDFLTAEEKELLEHLNLPLPCVSQPWSTLSGGEKQRCLLWVALCSGPSVLLLDEPTSALDKENVATVERALHQSGKTILWVTHDEAQAQRVAALRLSLY